MAMPALKAMGNSTAFIGRRLRMVNRCERFGKQIWLVTGGIEQMGAGLVDRAAQLCLVYAQHQATAFAHAPADDDGIDIAALNRMHHGGDGIVDKVEIEVAGADEYQVGLLAWRQAAYALFQSRASGVVDRGGLQQPERIGWCRRMV